MICLSHLFTYQLSIIFQVMLILEQYGVIQNLQTSLFPSHVSWLGIKRKSRVLPTRSWHLKTRSYLEYTGGFFTLLLGLAVFQCFPSSDHDNIKCSPTDCLPSTVKKFYLQIWSFNVKKNCA